MRLFKKRLTAEQKQRIVSDYGILEKRIDDYYHQESRKKDRARNDADNKCPHCGNTNESDIVNKIARTHGKVGGDFALGFGSVYGSTDTDDVRHCNVCGNQWKKAKYESYWKSKAHWNAFHGLDYWARKNWDAWIYEKEYALFKGLCGEAIHKYISDNNKGYDKYSIDHFDKKILINHFGSVRDD